MTNTARDKSIKAVGFAFFSPEVVVMFADHDNSHIHVYPSKSGKSLELSEDRDNVVVLMSLDKRYTLVDFADSIHRLLVFGKPDDLLKLGLPLLDATVDEDGTVVPLHRQSRATMHTRIEEDAVPLSLVSDVSSTIILTAKKISQEPTVNLSFVSRLRALRSEVKAAGNTIDFVADVGMPAVLRIMNDYTREQIKDSCKKMVVDGGVSEASARDFFRWIEGIGYQVSGITLGSALEKFLYPQGSAEEKPKAEDLAKRFNVDKSDIEFVAQSYQQLLKEEKE